MAVTVTTGTVGAEVVDVGAAVDEEEVVVGVSGAVVSMKPLVVD